MKIAVTGGKGGTGKSTVATALAMSLAQEKKVLLLDLDVDCPNDDLILSIKKNKAQDIKNMIPVIDKTKCIKCGQCSRICREGAIVQVKKLFPIIVPEQCTGCRACKLACPVGAISEDNQVIGQIYTGKGKVDLITGEIKPGIEESSLVVNAVKKFAKKLEKDYDIIIVDTAAGTHCPVIAALLEVDLGIAVTEPTPLGEHDLGLILELMKKLGVKAKIVLNKADIADKKGIQKTADKFNSEIIAEIPYSKEIQEQYTKGKVIVHKSIDKIKEFLNKK